MRQCAREALAAIADPELAYESKKGNGKGKGRKGKGKGRKGKGKGRKGKGEGQGKAGKKGKGKGKKAKEVEVVEEEVMEEVLKDDEPPCEIVDLEAEVQEAPPKKRRTSRTQPPLEESVTKPKTPKPAPIRRLELLRSRSKTSKGRKTNTRTQKTAEGTDPPSSRTKRRLQFEDPGEVGVAPKARRVNNAIAPEKPKPRAKAKATPKKQPCKSTPAAEQDRSKTAKDTHMQKF